MFGATCDAAPVATSVDVGTTSAGRASAVPPDPGTLCKDAAASARRGTPAATDSAPVGAPELASFLDDDFVHPACDSGGRGTTRSRQRWRGASTP
jgi:hypothetical protein